MPTPEIDMPAGRYLSLSGIIRAVTGGQTRALLMRNRLLTQHAGIPTTLTTFDSDPVYDDVRAALAERGELVEGMRLLNLFDYYRSAEAQDISPDASVAHYAGALPIIASETKDELHPDGTVYSTGYVDPATGSVNVRDYRRPDGSVFARVPVGHKGAVPPASPYILVNRDGTPTRSWATQGGWGQHWLSVLAGDAERVFVISDSRFQLRHVIPHPDPRFHFLHLMHNNHLVAERRWDSKLSADYAPLFANIAHIDTLVTLTKRQQEDVTTRYGRTTNLAVVPNPVELPVLPDPMPARLPATFAAVSRLEGQKRLDHAIRAFAKVVEKRPEARFEIYGKGELRATLQALIDQLGVGENVKLMGHDPRAKAALLTATGFIMTSVNEGYPLATLESFSYGCPVVSYDIKYGPRDQITDGVDGFVVPPGDMDAVAERVIRMIDDPALVQRLSAGALEKAQQHDYRAFLRDWRVAIEQAIEQKPLRVHDVVPALRVHEIGYAPQRRLPGRLGRLRASAAAWRSSRPFEVAGTLELQGRWPRGDVDAALGDAVLTLEAVCRQTGDVVALPLDVDRSGTTFSLRSSFDIESVFDEVGAGGRTMVLRFRVVLRNWSWQTEVRRGGGHRPNYEVFYDAGDAVRLQRRG